MLQMGKAVVHEEGSRTAEGSLEGHGVIRMTAIEHVRLHIAK